MTDDALPATLAERKQRAPSSAEETSLPLGAALPRDHRRALVFLRLARGAS